MRGVVEGVLEAGEHAEEVGAVGEGAAREVAEGFGVGFVGVGVGVGFVVVVDGGLGVAAEAGDVDDVGVEAVHAADEGVFGGGEFGGDFLVELLPFGLAQEAGRVGFKGFDDQDVADGEVHRLVEAGSVGVCPANAHQGSCSSGMLHPAMLRGASVHFVDGQEERCR